MTDFFAPLPTDEPATGEPGTGEPATDEPATGEPETGRPERVDAVAALAYGRRAFRANAARMLFVVAVPVGAEIVVAAVSRSLLDSVAYWFLAQIVTVVVGAIASLGAVRRALAISGAVDTSGDDALDDTRGSDPERGAFGYDRWAAWIVFAGLFGLLEGIGLVLCVVPGVVFLAYFGLAPYFFVDRGMTVGGALRASREAVTGNGLAFAVLVAIVVGSLGVVACVVGVLVTQAVAALALAYLYRHVAAESAPA